jgi:hypothetical protein
MVTLASAIIQLRGHPAGFFKSFELPARRS